MTHRRIRRLGSPVGSASHSHRSAAEPEYLYLTTTGRRTGTAREIEIWFTRDADRYYLVSELRQRAQWVRNVLAEPRVQWRVGTATFLGRARVLGEPADGEQVRAAQARSRAKYGWGEGLVVELTPQAPR